MTKLKTTYKALENSTNEEIKEMYLELQDGTLPRGCKVNAMQKTLGIENGKTVPSINVMYHISMEAMKRFGNI